MNKIHYIDAKGPEGILLYAIGDVHGRLDLLEAMLGQIEAQIASKKPADWRIILLGDYVDRGPDSRGVLELIARQRAADSRFIALAGNHEAGMLSFLENPEQGALFARYGGRETAAAYGVDADFSSQGLTEKTRDALMRAVPESHIKLLEALPRSASFGDFFFCHAGIRPGVALDDQDPEDLIWIKKDFLKESGLHPKIIVHGHTPNDEAEILPNRVNVDTTAYRSGRLTALVIDGGVKMLISVGAIR